MPRTAQPNADIGLAVFGKKPEIATWKTPIHPHLDVFLKKISFCDHECARRKLTVRCECWKRSRYQRVGTIGTDDDFANEFFSIGYHAVVFELIHARMQAILSPGCNGSVEKKLIKPVTIEH
jgi:hypothetical protein